MNESSTRAARQLQPQWLHCFSRPASTVRGGGKLRSMYLANKLPRLHRWARLLAVVLRQSLSLWICAIININGIDNKNEQWRQPMNGNSSIVHLVGLGAVGKQL